jgi:hypothetical protein
MGCAAGTVAGCELAERLGSRRWQGPTACSQSTSCAPPWCSSLPSVADIVTRPYRTRTRTPRPHGLVMYSHPHRSLHPGTPVP